MVATFFLFGNALVRWGQRKGHRIVLVVGVWGRCVVEEGMGVYSRVCKRTVVIFVRVHRGVGLKGHVDFYEWSHR